MKEGKIMTVEDKIRSMTNEELALLILGYRIRNMTHEELALFLWWYEINIPTIGLQCNGKDIKSYDKLKEWLEEEFNPDDPWFANLK